MNEDEQSSVGSPRRQNDVIDNLAALTHSEVESFGIQEEFREEEEFRNELFDVSSRLAAGQTPRGV